MGSWGNRVYSSSPVSNGPPKAMIRVLLPNRCGFAPRSFLNVPVSARPFSAQNVAPLLVNPSNVTKDSIFVDASWHMPNSPRKAREEFLKKRLPQARFLDLEEVAKEHALGLKHMIPDPKVFAKYCGEHPRPRPPPFSLRPTRFITSRTFRNLESFPRCPVMPIPPMRRRQSS